jgi:hypothetical protein
VVADGAVSYDLPSACLRGVREREGEGKRERERKERELS